MFFSRRSGIAAFLKYCPCSRTAQRLSFQRTASYLRAVKSPKRIAANPKKGCASFEPLEGRQAICQTALSLSIPYKKVPAISKTARSFCAEFLSSCPGPIPIGRQNEAVRFTGCIFSAGKRPPVNSGHTTPCKKGGRPCPLPRPMTAMQDFPSEIFSLPVQAPLPATISYTSLFFLCPI